MTQNIDVILLNSHGEEIPIEYNWEGKKECLVDMINRRIFFNGVMLNSNDLRSQNFTAQFLYKLCTSKGKALTIADLPKGSYTESRYDFDHKIVRPIEQCAKKYLEKEFKVVCVGSLHNFKIKLVYSNLDIYFLVNREEMGPKTRLM